MDRTTTVFEKNIITAIIEGSYPIGSSLPSERELAKIYEVGRPAVREVLQRLSVAGWIHIRKGQPAIVNDFWKQGNIMTIVNIVETLDVIPDQLVLYFLEFRGVISPSYVKKAVKSNHLKVVTLLTELDALRDDPKDFAQFDWYLQKEIALLSENPLYLFILNSFNSAYERMAIKYFSHSFSRQASLQYYHQLLKAALTNDEQKAENVTRQIMEKSYALWKSHLAKQSHGNRKEEKI